MLWIAKIGYPDFKDLTNLYTQKQMRLVYNYKCRKAEKYTHSILM